MDYIGASKRTKSVPFLAKVTAKRILSMGFCITFALLPDTPPFLTTESVFLMRRLDVGASPTDRLTHLCAATIFKRAHD